VSADAAPAEDAGARIEQATPSNALLAGIALDGAAAADALASDGDGGTLDRARYLAARRCATAMLSYWRRHLPIAGETAFGPEVATDEAGGAVGALDRAMQSGNVTGAARAAERLAAAFHVTSMALATREVSRGAVGQAASDAVYRAGEAALEATPWVPEGDDAALADVLGFVDMAIGGSQALGLDVGTALAPLEAARSLKMLVDLRDRAAFVRATGTAGSAIRRALRALPGERLAPELLYRPLDAANDIAALTLPKPAWPVTSATAALGERLFTDHRLSRGGVRACTSCHDPARAYDDGRATPASLVPGTPLLRNTPTLLYAPLEARLMWDGRVRTADRQALRVLHAAAEMGATDNAMVRAVSADAAYAIGFRSAFEADGGAAGPDAGDMASWVTPANIGRALAAYEASAFVPGRAPIDRFARGDTGALTADERAGLDVFAGKGRCARCHVPPVFGGSRPPDFTAPIFAVLGVPSSPASGVLDADLGRGDGAFRVPTVRNIARTAPYFHNGGFATLEEVVDFYDRGGGRALGFPVENQDPEVRPLTLSPEDKRVLLVFLRSALSDEGSGEDAGPKR
jgi:cytochrome c peroxidase